MDEAVTQMQTYNTWQNGGMMNNTLKHKTTRMSAAPTYAHERYVMLRGDTTPKVSQQHTRPHGKGHGETSHKTQKQTITLNDHN